MAKCLLAQAIKPVIKSGVFHLYKLPLFMYVGMSHDLVIEVEQVEM